MKKLFTFLCLLALALPGRALTSTNSVTVTNNLGGPLTLSLYSVAAGSYTLAGLQTIATNGSATLTGSGTNWAGALVLNTNNNLAVVVSWNAWASNVFTTSYLLSVGVHQIISIGGAGAPGGITSGGSTTNPPSLNTNTPGVSTNPPSVTQLPVSVLVGTNTPNGHVTAGYGSLYNQFDVATGTNFVQQWIKQNATGSTNWSVVSTGGTNGTGGVTNLAAPTFQTTTLTNTATGHAVALSQAAGVLGQGLTVAGEVKATGGFETPGGGFLADSSGNVTGLTFTGNGGGLTGLSAAAISGTLNPAISATQSVYAADVVSMTNQPLSCASIGGIIANAASKGCAVVLGLGDSYTASTGLENIGEGSGVSTSYAIGKQLRLAYGDGGCAGACSGVSYGWANLNPGPLNSSLIVPTNIWPRSSDGSGGAGIAVLTTNVGTNAVWTSQINNVGGWVPVCSNIVNLAGICYVTSTNGGSVQVSIGSPSSGVTNSYTLNTLSYAPSFIRTNWAVAPASDYSIVVTNLTGATNYIVCPVLLNTNAGVQYWQFGFAGSHNDTILSIGTNMWQQIYAAVNPDVVIYNDIHFGSSTDPAGTNTVAYTNTLVNWLSGFPAKTVVNMIGNPPNNGGSQQPINFWYKVLCCSFTNWTYTDLWSPWASFTNSFNLGLFETTNNTGNIGAQTGVHPSMAGMWARAAEACKQMNIRPIVPAQVPASSIVGIIPLGSYAAAVLTNNMAAAVLKDLNITGGVNGLKVDNYFLYDGSTEMAVAGGGLLIYAGQLEIRYGENINFTSGTGNINGAGTISGNQANLASLLVTNNETIYGSLILSNTAAAGASSANTGHFWPSNTALYWVTPTHTNYVTGP